MQTQSATEPAHAAEAPRGRPPTMLKAPVFMVGSVRSGTSLLRIMMGSHPKIAANPEFGMAVDRMDEQGDFPPLDAYHRWLAHDRIAGLYQFHVDPTLDYPHLVDSFLQQRRQREGKPVVTATVHHHYDRLPRIWPDAKFIYIYRDGRDVARSIIEMGWAGNYWTGVQRWIDAETIWARFAPTLPEDRKLEVCYEHLIERPDEQLARICGFYGVEFDKRIYDYAKTSTYGLPDPKYSYQWKRRLTEEQIRLAEARIGPMLARRGYELSGLPALEVTPTMQRRLRRQDWWYRARFRMRRYGLPLFMADYVVRRTGPRRLQERLLAKLNAIDNSHLK